MLPILLLSIAFFLIFYRYFGSFLNKRCGIDDDKATPAHTKKDGIDFVPTRASILFGHHFSSIAGAGPIVGPILAGMYFGWGPTWLWILIGAALVGGIHDFGSTFISVRTGGKTIAEAMKNIVGKKTGKLFALFVLCALIYVVIVFLDLTATTFQSTPEVASASTWFIVVALGFGFILMRKVLPFPVAILIWIPLTYAGLAFGHFFPAPNWSKETYTILILGYCYIAAILPVQVLLQPRDFLSATFLYVMLSLGLVGVLFSGHPLQIDFFSGWKHENAGSLFPILFITVACGACSGFHSIVSSGTTSKQINKEKDICRINYGGMLIEGLLAVFALGTLAILSQEDRTAAGTPVAIFATGAGKFMSVLGLPLDLAREFTLLAVSTFLLTTLDTCTRLSRFILEEFLQLRNAATRYFGTLAVLILPGLAVFQTIDGKPAWQAIWPMFGATNQLMAALALLTFLVFLKASKIKFGFVIPATVIMVIMPLTALSFMAFQSGPNSLIGGMSIAMLILGSFVTLMAVRFVLRSHGEQEISSTKSEI